MEKSTIAADFIFEVSWEVCNKVGGIHTVLSSKAATVMQEWEDRVVMIGPDIWKGTAAHPEFDEDKFLFADWRHYAAKLGIRARVGRWRIQGSPPVILVDFTPYFQVKNDIFSHLWVRYQLDSLTGQWDYIEPAMFGYTAGKVIESFYHYHLTYSDKIVAHFHEWMTGVGLLYLEENVPQIGTIFTTHATALGRSIAGNGQDLYGDLQRFDPGQEARRFNVLAKHSLERCAARFVDCFTTVSEITAKECAVFLDKTPDVITINGFDTAVVPDYFLFQEKRYISRKKLLDVASALKGKRFADNSILLLKSGRYEFRNKGIDAFIASLGLLKRDYTGRDIVAFIFVPAGHTGFRKDLAAYLHNNSGELQDNHFITHNLLDSDTDPITGALQKVGLTGNDDSHIHVVFSPVYLDGQDGIYDMTYYDLLLGFDVSVFPSYYEPWGYTPQESVAYYVPTLTTDNAGYGTFLLHQMPANDIQHGAMVIERGEKGIDEIKLSIAEAIMTFANLTAEQVKIARLSAHSLSNKTLWKNTILNYKKAFSIALAKTTSRTASFRHELPVHPLAAVGKAKEHHSPKWRKVFVETKLPEELKALEAIMGNFWWTWQPEARHLFAAMHPELWEQCNHNPFGMLEQLSGPRLKELAQDSGFINQLKSVQKRFEAYMEKPMKSLPAVAYFCSEFGIYSGLEQYSGGLGILAGDLLKQASDDGVPMVGIGLLYRFGYFKQDVGLHGDQIALEVPQKFTCQPLHPVMDAKGNWLKISIALPGRTLYAQVRRADIGRTSLYLLDTDISENRPEDRRITGQLYGGDRENRLKQELLLGIGGMRLLQFLSISPDVFHLNEGHVAFASLERIRMLMYDENLGFEEALELVRSSSLFTTHTPVPAGHEVFSEELLRTYLSHFARLLNISWDRLMQLGSKSANNHPHDFSMSMLAANTCKAINAVSEKHEKVSRQIFAPLWEGYGETELFIGHVTNGVHVPTWLAPEVQSFVQSAHLSNDNPEALDEKGLWQLHMRLKRDLLDELKMRFNANTVNGNRFYKRYSAFSDALTEEALIIVFARRFVTYKRPTLLFSDTDRLSRIVESSPVPLMFLFAGKAHMKDGAGQDEIRQLLQLSLSPAFRGKLFFLLNYDMELASYLVRGADVWLNVPKDGMEASGTSGMKAAMNGVLNLSTADGWWAEAGDLDAGWTIPYHGAGRNGEDEWDADMLYTMLEKLVIPEFAARNKQGLPKAWIQKMKHAISGVQSRFNAGRMLDNYTLNYYKPIAAKHQKMRENAFAETTRLTAWKQRITEAWPGIVVVSTALHDTANKALPLGEMLNPMITLDLNGLSAEDVGVEMVIIEKRSHHDDPFTMIASHVLKAKVSKADNVVWSGKIPMEKAGVYEYGFRIFPTHPLLAHRQDLALVKWV